METLPLNLQQNMSSDEECIQMTTMVNRQPARRLCPPVPQKPSFTFKNDSSEKEHLMNCLPTKTSTSIVYPLKAHLIGPSSSNMVGITDAGVTVEPNGSLNGQLMVNGFEEDEEETDEELVDTLGQNTDEMVKYSGRTPVLVPSKSQVTDSSNYPLFDVWLELDCCRCTWVIEAYGRTVLLLHDKAGSPGCSRSISRQSPPISITDWNGDLFGHMTPDDPFLLQNSEKTTVAKLVPHGGSTLNVQEMGVLSTTRAKRTGTKELCWLSLHEGSGHLVARLDGLDQLTFNKNVAFQLKLLTLAGIIRLSAPWNMPNSRSRNSHFGLGVCWSTLSSILNCCAYCLY